MAKRESIVPGLGKQQAKVLNNEAGRRAEHKRHLEELGFPKEVDPAFMRYAPVSYDDETPYPSKVVNQAGEDLGFTPKDSLMKSDIQSIVKEAVNEVFISKQPREKPPGFKDVDTWLKPKEPRDYSELFRFPTLEEKQSQGNLLAGFNHLGRLFEIGAKEGLLAINDVGNAFEKIYKDTGAWKLFPDSWVANPEGITQKDIKDFESKLTPSQQKEFANATDKAVNQFIKVDLKDVDPAGVPKVFQPGGRPDTGKTFQSGAGQTKDQSMDPTLPVKVTPDQPDASGVPLRFQPGMRGTPAGRGETQEFVPGPGQTKDQTPPAPKPKSIFGQLGPRKIDNIQERDGKLYGTVSGSGTSPYQIQVKPEQYGGVKAGDTINYNPAQDPKAFTITSGDTTTAGKRPGPTLAEVQAQRARANPSIQPKDSPYLKNMQKYQAWLQKAEDEGAMAKVQLDRVSDLADMMHDILEDEDQLPGWIQNKISDSLHNLEASMTHIMYDEKEERDLVKSKEVFQDFLVRAPQGGGTLLNDELFLRKFWMGALIGAGIPLATKVVPKLIKVLPKIFRGSGKSGKSRKLIFDGTKKNLSDGAKKSGLGTLATVTTLGVAGGTIEDAVTGAAKSGNITDIEAKDVLAEFQNIAGDYQNKLNQSFQNSSKELLDQSNINPNLGMENFANAIPEGSLTGQGVQKVTEYLDDKFGKGAIRLQPAETTQGPPPKLESDQLSRSTFDPATGVSTRADRRTGQGLSDSELGRRGVKLDAPSSIEPIYDTSPAAEAKVRAGGSSSILGANVDGQKYQFKKPVSNMGQINQALQRATPVQEIVKEAVFELSKAKKKGGRKKDPRLERAGVAGFNKPKRTPKHPKKSHVVVAKEGNKVKTIRFGEQGAKTAGDRKKGESAKMRKKRKSFKARHRKNIKRGKMSAAYWADKVKW